MLKGKKILLGITGSIAAYKTALLIRALIREGAEVRVVMTPAAVDFIGPLTLATLSRHPVMIEPFQPENGEWASHIEIGSWADVFIIAPLTANTMSKMAQGQADNLLLAVYLTARCPVFFAPVMDVDMFNHPSTQKNLHTLVSFGNILIDPDEGELASGLTGKGRMKDPEEIIGILETYFKKKSPLSGKKALVTAGPTYERLDSVRFVGNFSSGKMGFALAEALASSGAEVILVTGPVSLTTNHPGISVIRVESAAEMAEACMKAFPFSDITVMAAAVADFRPAQPAKSKIKKKEESLNVTLEPTVDILATLGKHKKHGQILAGFALETDHELENAILKMKHKNLDLIVLNSLNDPGAGFGHDTNKVSIVTAEGDVVSFPLKKKTELACDIVNLLLKRMKP